MRRGASIAAAILVGAIIAVAASCAPQGTEAERRRDAARADSSAAGYEVGPLRDVPEAAATSSAPPAPPAVVAAVSRASAGTANPAPARAARSDSARARPAAPARRDTAVSKATPPPAPVTPAPIAPVPAPVDTGPVQDGEFLWYDASQKLARLRLVAGYSGVNDGLNFNGWTSGNRTVVVPLGWRVVVTVANDDDALSHSALVAPHELPVAPEPPPPAFEGARIPSAARGVAPGEMEEMRFAATSAGRFLLMCGVPGHGEGGMWITLEVSGSAAVPAYR